MMSRRYAIALPFLSCLAHADITEKSSHGHHGVVVPCTESVTKHCCGDGVCSGAENQNNCLGDCPGVTTQPMCGEEPHSDRGGRTLSFGVGHRASSAQDCCDKCAAHAKSGRQPSTPCNSWTFCGYPVCWGLDTGARRARPSPFSGVFTCGCVLVPFRLDAGWNHTFGEW